MKIFKIEAELGEYESFQLVNKNRDFLREFKCKILSGKPQKGKLDNLVLEMIGGEKFSDSPKFWSGSGILLFSEKAKRTLEDLLKNYVEFIPVKSKNVNFYIVNTLCIEDAIDYKKAELRMLDTGLIVGIEKYSFIENKVCNIPMFKVLLNDRIYSTEIYVTSEFKNKVEEAKLEGFKFIEVWEF